jgi:uncharacterized membrane protein YtjA (UPF0391 family)
MNVWPRAIVPAVDSGGTAPRRPIIGPPMERPRGLPRWGVSNERKEDIMFGWAITFLVIALIAGLLGFGVVAGTAFAAAKIVFVVALIAFLISGVLGVSGRGVP